MSNTYQMVIVHVPSNTTWKNKPQVITDDDVLNLKKQLGQILRNEAVIDFITTDDQFMIIGGELLKNCAITLRKLPY